MKHEVTILDPGIKDDFAEARGVWESQFSANIFIKPPIRIGHELGNLIGGKAGNIIISEVASTDEGTHAIVACAQGRESHSSGAQAVEQAMDRLRTYLNADPSQFGTLRDSFAQEPLLASYSARQM